MKLFKRVKAKDKAPAQKADNIEELKSQIEALKSETESVKGELAETLRKIEELEQENAKLKEGLSAREELAVSSADDGESELEERLKNAEEQVELLKGYRSKSMKQGNCIANVASVLDMTKNSDSVDYLKQQIERALQIIKVFED